MLSTIQVITCKNIISQSLTRDSKCGQEALLYQPSKQTCDHHLIIITGVCILQTENPFKKGDLPES